MAYPVREVFVRVVRVRGFWAYYLPLDVVMSLSMIYELIEWAIAIFVGGDVGQSYLGTQGDEWDAHKDMALATLGGLIAMTVTALVNWRYDRDFAKQFAASLHVSSTKPLGEVRCAKFAENLKAISPFPSASTPPARNPSAGSVAAPSQAARRS